MSNHLVPLLLGDPVHPLSDAQASFCAVQGSLCWLMSDHLAVIQRGETKAKTNSTWMLMSLSVCPTFNWTVWVIFCCAEAFSFMWPHFFIFAFVVCALGLISYKIVVKLHVQELSSFISFYKLYGFKSYV